MTSSTPVPSADVDLLLDIEAPRRARSQRRDGAGRDVLVIDSVAIARKFLMQRLERFGYRAQGAERGDDALARLGTQPFAVVFCELSLGPDDPLDGLGLCRAVKQLPRAGGTGAPGFVLVTGRLGASDRVRGALAGCNAYLTKPLDESALLAVLAGVDPAFR
ncbi:response regulator [Rhizobacter fulvus]